MITQLETAFIDDVQIWTGLELKQFLSKEKAWAFVKTFAQPSAYRKTGDDYAREWEFHPYVVSKSRLPRIMTTLQILFRLLSHGKFSDLTQKIQRRLAKSN